MKYLRVDIKGKIVLILKYFTFHVGVNNFTLLHTKITTINSFKTTTGATLSNEI